MQNQANQKAADDGSRKDQTPVQIHRMTGKATTVDAINPRLNFRDRQAKSNCGTASDNPKDQYHGPKPKMGQKIAAEARPDAPDVFFGSWFQRQVSDPRLGCYQEGLHRPLSLT